MRVCKGGISVFLKIFRRAAEAVEKYGMRDRIAGRNIHLLHSVIQRMLASEGSQRNAWSEICPFV